jgi:hypothetical protein
VAFFFGALSVVIIGDAGSPSGLLGILIVGRAVRLVLLNVVGAALACAVRLASTERHTAPWFSIAIQALLAATVLWEAFVVAAGLSDFGGEIGKLGLFLGANLVLGLTALVDLARSNRVHLIRGWLKEKR